MDAQRAQWGAGQQELRRLLGQPEQHEAAIPAFLRQHGALHAAALAAGSAWSFQDEVLSGLADEEARRPDGNGHSVAWLLWHIARIEDVTMTMLVAGSPQVLQTGAWDVAPGLDHREVGTGMSDAETGGVSARLDVAALRDYRLAVGRRTREIVAALSHEDLRQTIPPARIKALLAARVLPPPALPLAEVWGRWRVARFLLMPATRHSFTHLNAARRLRRRPRGTAAPPSSLSDDG